MNTTSPKSSLAKLGLGIKQKSIKIMVLGQAGVGKTALVVRFITKRFIGEYDPTLEKMYSCNTLMDKEMAYFDILDTAGQTHESMCSTLETNIKWAEAFILVYSVTDKCSFDECNRLKFLINYNKRRKRLGSSGFKDEFLDVPVVLVGNKTDQNGDRMVSIEDGQRRSKEIGCVCFHEISVRESIDQVWSVFHDVCRFWKVHAKSPRLMRSGSNTHSDSSLSPETLTLGVSIPAPPTLSPILLLGRRWTETGVHSTDKTVEGGMKDDGEGIPFRGRASTDGHILSRPRRLRNPIPSSPLPSLDRRMSISMRGNNAGCYQDF